MDQAITGKRSETATTDPHPSTDQSVVVNFDTGRTEKAEPCIRFIDSIVSDHQSGAESVDAGEDVVSDLTVLDDAVLATHAGDTITETGYAGEILDHHVAMALLWLPRLIPIESPDSNGPS
jgi:hypothetical protein